jgi:TP901 family phage tail tape measure protein
MKQVRAELAGVAAEVEAVNKAMLSAAASPIGNGKLDNDFLKRYSQKLVNVRKDFQSAIDTQGAFNRQSMSVASHSDRLLESLQRQKFGMRDLIREHKNLAQVYHDQVALQKSAVMQWGTGPNGAQHADMLTPRAVDTTSRSFSELTRKAGFYNQVLSSVADQTVKWGKNTQWAGRQLMAGLSMPMAMVGAATGVMAYQIDKGLTQVVKVYGDAATAATTTDKEIKEATLATARHMASAFGQSAQDSIEITSQLASAGKTGKELQEATAEVTRARTLGELDLQDAMKATITLQSVYGMNSQKLGETFNFMNSMENQTALTMQDFVVGIPKVSGVLKEFGGDVQDAGILLAGMKAAGIDAAEGANAIKSIAFKVISPNQGAKDMFETLTGKSFAETMKGTEGVVGRLKVLGQAMSGLSEENRVGLVQKMFGLYQGSKTLGLLSQLTNESEQMTRAFDVANQGAAGWAGTASRELEKLQNSGWNKVKQQWETLKIEMADVGATFLTMATPIIKFFVDLVKKFNGLDDGTKKFILFAGGIAALIGPIIMLAGLLGNLIGNVGKLTTFLSGLVLKFKLQNTEQVMAEKLANKAAKSTLTEAESFHFLALKIKEATAALSGMNIAQHNATLAAGNFDSRRNIYQSKSGATMYRAPSGRSVPAGGKSFADKRAEQISRDHDEALLMNRTAQSSQKISAESERTRKAWKDISGSTKMYAAAGVAGTVGMVAPSGSVTSNIANSVMMGTMMATMITPLLGKVSILSKAWLTVATNARFAGAIIASGVRGPITKAASAFASFLPALAPVGLALAGIGVAAGATWYIINKGIQQSRKEAEALGKSAQTYAEVIGFGYKEASEKGEGYGKVVDDLTVKTRKFVEANGDAAKVLNEQGHGKSEEEQLRIAANEAVKARLHGASEQQGVEAAQIALRAMQSKIQDQQVEWRLKAIVDLSDMKSVVDSQVKNIRDTIDNAVNNEYSQGKRESFARFFLGNDDLNASGAATIEASAKEMWNVFENTSEAEQALMFDRMRTNVMDKEKTMFDKMQSEHSETFKKFGINTRQDLAKWMKKSGGDQQALNVLGINTDEAQEFQRAMDATRISIQVFGKAAGLSDEEVKKMLDFSEIRDALPWLQRLGGGLQSVTTSEKQWNQYLDMGKTGLVEWTDAEKLARLNLLRRRAGLDKATSVEQGFGDALENTKDNLYAVADAHKAVANAMKNSKNGMDDGGVSLEMNEENVGTMMNSMKSAYSSAMDSIYTEAAYIMDQQNQAVLDGIQKRGDDAQALLDSQQERMQARFENQNKNFESRWDNMMKSLDSKQKARKEAIEKSYDDRIRKIDDTIKAEQDAEATRQKIFEAEKTRIQRLADMYNRNVNINMAINSGNLDEAAKLSNDAQATQEGWLVDDAAGTTQTSSDKRIADLEKKKEVINLEKDARLKALDAVDAREKDALEARKVREKDALKATQDAESKKLDARKKALDASTKAELDSTKRRQEANKRLLDIELASLKAHIPQNEAQLKAHIGRVETAYDYYGGKLKLKGTGWGNTVGAALKKAVDVATVSMSNDVAWEALGKVAADKMAQGAFNMTLSQFMNWVSTGALPTGYKAPSKITKGEAAKYTSMGIRVAGVNSRGGLTKDAHSGGIVGEPGGKRTGFSGPYSKHSEVQMNLLKGEAVLNRSATRELGTDFVAMANKGILPKGVGGDLSGVGGLMAGLMGGMLRGAMAQGLAAAGNRQMAQDTDSGLGWSAVTGKAGKYGGSRFDATQLRNAATIASTGKTVGASSRDIIIALMTAMQESTLRNLNSGHLDSLGLFQQRSAWGAAGDRTNPAAAARMFFLGGKSGQRGLLDFPTRDKMSLGQAAQAVQVSAYPGAYTKWQDEAQAILSSLSFTQALGDGGELTPGGWVRPASGPRTSGYGMRWGRMHTGSDIGGVIGRPIYASRAGRVVQAKVRGNKGNHIQLDHGGGIQTGYSHLSRFGVAVGDSVRQGQQIGWMGNTGNSTGPHLHFEYLRNGQTFNPGMIIPGLNTGGFTMSDGLAMLHKDETVLTAPLSQNLKEGINNMDKSSHIVYDVSMNFDGANFASDVDVKNAVKTAMKEIELEHGPRRKIGDRY